MTNEIVKLENLGYVYQEGTPFEFEALHDINISIKKGELVGIIGPTGSGKSTLIQHFNGLLSPTSGNVIVCGRNINQKKDKKKNKKSSICFQVGLVFQYPEYQLFEETVYNDIAFGPKNMGLSEDKVELRVKKAMESMNLDFEKMKDRSPFSLSGGEMRRVALAGVLAMEPEALVLDEPTASLDPMGRVELRQLILQFHNLKEMTLVLVSHEMGEIAKIVDHLIVLNQGRVVADGSPQEIFKRQDWILKLGLGLPPFMELMNRLAKRNIKVRADILNLNEAVEEIIKLYRQNH